MKVIQNFFLYCSGAYSTLLHRSPSEVQKYVGVGATVFFTGILAMVSCAYAVFTIFESYIAAIIFGAVWGLMIFNLDRYLVSSMRKSNSGWKDFLSATPRIILAVMIAIVISKPLEVKIFETEIRSELVLMEQERYKDQESIAKSRYRDDIQEVEDRMTLLDQKIDSEKARVEALQNAAIAEADGTGGSQKRNMGPIYKLKKAEADLATNQFESFRDSVNVLLNSEAEILSQLRGQSDETLASLDETALTGLASRLEGLGRLAGKSNVIYWASIFITLLFIAVECSPIFVKLITKRGPYDYMLANLENKYQVKSDKEVALANLKKELEIDYNLKTKSAQTIMTVEAENEIFKVALQNSKEEILAKNPTWQTYKEGIKSLKLDL